MSSQLTTFQHHSLNYHLEDASIIQLTISHLQSLILYFKRHSTSQWTIFLHHSPTFFFLQQAFSTDQWIAFPLTSLTHPLGTTLISQWTPCHLPLLISSSDSSLTNLSTTSPPPSPTLVFYVTLINQFTTYHPPSHICFWESPSTNQSLLFRPLSPIYTWDPLSPNHSLTSQSRSRMPLLYILFLISCLFNTFTCYLFTLFLFISFYIVRPRMAESTCCKNY